MRHKKDLRENSNVGQRIGMGVDIEEVARFCNLSRTHHRRFLERVFTLREQRYCFSKKNPAPHLATRFCAKEAVVKAMASLGVHKIPYRSIEIVHVEEGVPNIKLVTQYKNYAMFVSLSHTKDYAIASVMVTHNL